MESKEQKKYGVSIGIKEDYNKSAKVEDTQTWNWEEIGKRVEELMKGNAVNELVINLRKHNPSHINLGGK
ncbi:MAG: hypothetical protein V3U92_19575 [Cellulophaga sp.]